MRVWTTSSTSRAHCAAVTTAAATLAARNARRRRHAGKLCGQAHTRRLRRALLAAPTRRKAWFWPDGEGEQHAGTKTKLPAEIDDGSLMSDLMAPLTSIWPEERDAAIAKIRLIIAMLQRQLALSGDRAIAAEQERDAARKESEDLYAHSLSLQEKLRLMTRYAEDMEQERDEARATLEAEQEARKADREKWAAMVRSMEGALLRRRIGAPPPGAAVAKNTPPPPAAMDEDALRNECQQRGLPEDGSLAVLRMRVRAARARARQTAVEGAQ